MKELAPNNKYKSLPQTQKMSRKLVPDGAAKQFRRD